MCFVQLAAFYLVTAAAQAQTFASRPASAAMPQAHMQKHIGGSDNIERSMVIGLECMQKMQMSGDTDKGSGGFSNKYHQQAVG